MFDDSFEQLCRPIKKKIASSSNATITKDDPNSTNESLPRESMIEFLSVENTIEEEECEALDRMFKNIDIGAGAAVPTDWFENGGPHVRHMTSFESDGNTQLPTVYEDNESNYRSSKSINSTVISKDHLNLSKDSLNNSTRQTQLSKDSLELSGITSKSTLPIPLNDTLEDVEYVCEQNRYLLKPVSTKSIIPCSPVSSVSSFNVDTSTILIESSPESSFTATRNESKLLHANDVKSETSDTSSIPCTNDKSSVSWNSADSNKENSVISIISSTNGSYTTANNGFKSSDHDHANSKNTCVDSSDSNMTTSTWEPVLSLVSIGNSSFATAKNKLNQMEAVDIKSEISEIPPIDLCISYPKTASFFEPEPEDSSDYEITKSSYYYTALESKQSSSTLSSSLTSQPSVSSARFVNLKS